MFNTFIYILNLNIDTSLSSTVWDIIDTLFIYYQRAKMYGKNPTEYYHTVQKMFIKYPTHVVDACIEYFNKDILKNIK